MEDRWAQQQAEAAEAEALLKAQAEALTKKQRAALQVGGEGRGMQEWACCGCWSYV